jgi:hypothetical protein
MSLALPPAYVSAAHATALDQQFFTHKQQAETKFQTLRDSHRLAIHTCEDHLAHQVPLGTFAMLRELTPEMIAQGVSSKNIPVLSMSLLPSSASGKAMLPYAVGANSYGGCTYLFDMNRTAEGKPAPVVLYASHKNINSGTSPYDKSYWKRDTTPELKKLYASKHSHTQCEWEQELDKDKVALSQKQLDTLGYYYEAGDVPDEGQPNVIRHNEILACASTEHIAAICVPCMCTRTSEAHFLPLAKLSGALMGLAHLEVPVNMELPVMLYKVNPDHRGAQWKTQQGDFEYVGKGRQELQQVVLETLAQIDGKWEEITAALHKSNMPKHLQIEVQSSLGIDLSKPLAEQKLQMEALERSFAQGRML